MNKKNAPNPTRVRLGEVVENVNEFFERHRQDTVRYVAGEHIDEGDLRVRRYGQTSDDLVPPTFNRLFRSGDVLFHSRNIRKLAQPDFSGLTGEKLFVLRSKDDTKLMQSFLPFLLQGEHFGRYVEERWAGSTNKFLNKSPLMAYEFPLPPQEQQRKIAEILQAIDYQGESLRSAHDAIRRLKCSLTETTFPVSEARAFLNAPRRYDGRPLVKLGQLTALQVGYPFKSTEYSSSGDRLLRGSNVGVNRLVWDPEITSYWPVDRRSEVQHYLLKAGDIVIAMDRPFISEGFKIARMAESDLPALLLQRVARFVVTGEAEADYIWAFLHSESFKWQLQRMQKGTGLPHVSKFDIEGTLIPALDKKEQKAISDSFLSIAAAEESLKMREQATRVLRAEVLHALVGFK